MKVKDFLLKLQSYSFELEQIFVSKKVNYNKISLNFSCFHILDHSEPVGSFILI